MRSTLLWSKRPTIERDVMGIGIVQKRWRSKCKRFLILGTEYPDGRSIFQAYGLDGKNTVNIQQDPTNTFRTRNAAIKSIGR
mgnify:CR=1 FL=1